MLLQNGVFAEKSKTLSHISDLLDKVPKFERKICIMPETCNSFYVKQHLHNNAEDFQNSETLSLLK